MARRYKPREVLAAERVLRIGRYAPDDRPCCGPKLYGAALRLACTYDRPCSPIVAASLVFDADGTLPPIEELLARLAPRSVVEVAGGRAPEVARDRRVVQRGPAGGRRRR